MLKALCRIGIPPAALRFLTSWEFRSLRRASNRAPPFWITRKPFVKGLSENFMVSRGSFWSR